MPKIVLFKNVWEYVSRVGGIKIRGLGILLDQQIEKTKCWIFGILGVKVGLKWDKIQEKFKKLVKKFHPDINSGDKSFEEKLKVITLAYTQLKNTYRQKIGK